MTENIYIFMKIDNSKIKLFHQLSLLENVYIHVLVESGPAVSRASLYDKGYYA